MNNRLGIVSLGKRIARAVIKNVAEYEELFGESFTVGREAEIERFRSGGFLTVAGGRIALTDKGMYVSNYILSSLL